jgi:hypothetical protein
MREFITKKTLRQSDSQREFDKEFWSKVKPEIKLSAAWEMVDEVNLIRGKKSNGQPRLQRSVQNIIRRKG